MRDYIIIHFILTGKGAITVENITYNLSSGQAFIIPANSCCWYIADKSDPWSYCWMSFYASSDILSLLIPSPSKPYIQQNINVQYIKSIILNIITKHFTFQKHQYSDEEFDSDHLHLSTNFDISFSFDMTASLYQILSYLISRNTIITTEKENRINDIKKYIECYYNEPLQIKKVAKEFSVHPNYLTSQFKATFGVSPKRYIINKRISVACNLLENSNYSIKEISYMVGYNNQLDFCQLFKKIIGKSPTIYRNHYKSHHPDK